MNIKLSLVAVLQLSAIFCFSQNVGIGTSTPNASAVLDVQSNNKGALLPRVTTAQRRAIANPEPGLMVFDTDKRTIMLYEGTRWGQLVFKDDETTEPVVRTITDGAADDYFGNSVSINNDYAVAGAYKDDVSGRADQGSVYVFHRVNGTWLQEAQLFASDGQAGDLFGYSVSISGNYIVAGAPEDNVGANSNQGSVYVFVRSGSNWSQLHKFVAPDGAADDHFGHSVSIDKNGFQFIVGAPQDDIGANTNQGSATIYNLISNVWVQEIKLTATGGLTDDQFGSSVAISGLYAIIAAPGDDNTGSYTGSAFIYTKIVTWQGGLIQKLTVSGSSTTVSFANSVTIDGTTAAVSLYIVLPFLPPQYTGQVYVYTLAAFGIWGQEAVINEPYSNNKNFFGYSLSLDGDKMAISARQLLTPVGYPDSSYISFYKRSGTVWEEQSTTFNNPAFSFGAFGSAVSLYGFNAITGAPERMNKKGEVSFINIE